MYEKVNNFVGIKNLIKPDYNIVKTTMLWSHVQLPPRDGEASAESS